MAAGASLVIVGRDAEKCRAAVKELGDASRGVHAATLSPAGDLLVDQWSTRDTPPRADILTKRGEVVRRLWESGQELEGWDLLPVEAGTLKVDDGTELFSLLVRPRGFDPTKRYPVILYVYGGPNSQGTADRWNGASCVYSGSNCSAHWPLK